MYIPVQESCTCTYTVHVSTGFSYWHVLVYTRYVLVHVFLKGFIPCVRIPDVQYHQQTGVLLYHIILFSIYYTHYITIKTLLYHLLFCKCPDYYFTLLHYPGMDYYITYDSSIISLIVFRIYYGNYYYYHTIICIIFTSNYYCYYLYWQTLFHL
jgi:hypothetical protein